MRQNLWFTAVRRVNQIQRHAIATETKCSIETEESVVLVLELIQGGSLTERLLDSTQRPMEAAELVERLASLNG